MDIFPLTKNPSLKSNLSDKQIKGSSKKVTLDSLSEPKIMNRFQSITVDPKEGVKGCIK
jgi:hypothetical protein